MPLTRATSSLINTNIVDLSTGNNIDCSAGTYFTKTLTGNTTFAVFNVPSNRVYAFTFELNLSSTLYSVTWWNGVVWPNASVPLLSAVNTVNLYMFVTDNGGVTWRGSALTNYS
jgi:hypothetical protein